VREDPHECKIIPRAPFMDNAKGPRIREQPLGRVTMVVANSFKVELKCPPRIPKWFMARGMKRLVELSCIGPREIESFLNLVYSAFLMT
jgi:hypothetical protein